MQEHIGPLFWSRPGHRPQAGWRPRAIKTAAAGPVPADSLCARRSRVGKDVLMHDPRVLLDPATDAARRLARRGYQLDLDGLGSLLSGRNSTIGEVESARAESKRTA